MGDLIHKSLGLNQQKRWVSWANHGDFPLMINQWDAIHPINFSSCLFWGYPKSSHQFWKVDIPWNSPAILDHFGILLMHGLEVSSMAMESSIWSSEHLVQLCLKGFKLSSFASGDQPTLAVDTMTLAALVRKNDSIYIYVYIYMYVR